MLFVAKTIYHPGLLPPLVFTEGALNLELEARDLKLETVNLNLETVNMKPQTEGK